MQSQYRRLTAEMLREVEHKGILRESAVAVIGATTGSFAITKIEGKYFVVEPHDKLLVSVKDLKLRLASRIAGFVFECDNDGKSTREPRLVERLTDLALRIADLNEPQWRRTNRDLPATYLAEAVSSARTAIQARRGLILAVADEIERTNSLTVGGFHRHIHAAEI